MKKKNRHHGESLDSDLVLIEAMIITEKAGKHEYTPGTIARF